MCNVHFAVLETFCFTEIKPILNRFFSVTEYYSVQDRHFSDTEILCSVTEPFHPFAFRQYQSEEKVKGVEGSSKKGKQPSLLRHRLFPSPRSFPFSFSLYIYLSLHIVLVLLNSNVILFSLFFFSVKFNYSQGLEYNFIKKLDTQVGLALP